MEFRTVIPIASAAPPIDYNSGIFSIGSCFAVNIAEKFQYFKFQNVVNPTGILFHPEAISNFFDDVFHQRLFSEEDLVFQNERFHCFDAHSEMSHTDPAAVLNLLNDSLATADRAVRNSSHVIITLGTAWVYRLQRTGKIVANCHKVPQKEFSKEILGVSRIQECVDKIAGTIRQMNQRAQIIFTISPVRHLKDGFVENQRSKANLLAGLHDALEDMRDATYFPSYEIMMDELRDYRFYADDMIHPSALAIEVIWERFSKTWISAEAISVMKEVDGIQKSLRHRPFNHDSKAHQDLLHSIEKKIKILQSRYPHIHFQNT